jgi:hypothetical protein
MPTECNPAVFEFPRLEGRAVVASFNGGRITSDAGALLLGATDRVLGLTRRLATCFNDSRNPAFVEHRLETLLMQRVVGSRSATRIWLTMMNSAMTRCWRCWPASLKPGAATVRRWQGKAH